MSAARAIFTANIISGEEGYVYLKGTWHGKRINVNGFLDFRAYFHKMQAMKAYDIIYQESLCLK